MSVETSERCRTCKEWRRTEIFVGKGKTRECVHCRYERTSPQEEEVDEEREVCPTCGRVKPGRPKKA